MEHKEKFRIQNYDCWPNDDCASEDHHESDSDDSSGRVIERQRIVEDRVFDGAQVAQVVHARAVEVESRVFYHSRFGETWNKIFLSCSEWV